MSPPEDIKFSPWKVFGKKHTLKSRIIWAGEALDDWTRGYLNITFLSAEKKILVWKNKFSALIEWKLGGLPHDCWKLQHTKLYKNV